MRPWSIHSWMRSKFAGARSVVKLSGHHRHISISLLSLLPLSLSLSLFPSMRKKGARVKQTNIHIIKPPFPMHDNLWRLPTIKPRRHLPMLFLTLITTSRGLPLPRPRTPTPSDLLAIGARVVRKRGENVGIAALLLELREQERQCWRRRKLRQAQRDLRPLVQRRQLEPGWHSCGVGCLYGLWCVRP